MSTPGTDLQPARMAPELDKYARIGQWLAAAEQKDPDPKAKGAAAALRLLYAESVGLPLVAAAEVSVIGGRLVVSARLLRALAMRQGYRVVPVDRTDTSCTAAVVDIDTGKEIGRSTFTMKDAERAGLIRERSAWKTHPGRMLWARASAFAVYDYAPDVALGVTTAEELDDSQDNHGRRTGPAPEPVDLTVHDLDKEVADAEDADFEPIDEELQTALDELGAKEVPSPFVAPTPKKSGS